MPGPIGTPPNLSSTPMVGAPPPPPSGGAVASGLDPALLKLTGIESLTVDGVDITRGALGVRPARAPSEATQAAGIQSQFPLQDLSLIHTEGRYAQGFRLDSGSLRLMYLSVRRTTESDGTPGFEVFFQAHGAAVERYKKRLEAAGAKSSTFQFYAADPDPDSPAGKAALKRNGQKWNPSGTSIALAQEGKWSVDFVTSAPEALKGAMRIRVSGPDADATKALNEVVTKLGLQTAFAPPSPSSLEKLKIMRLLWQISPGAADRLRLKPKDELVAHAELPALAKEADPTAAAAIDAADLSGALVKRRAALAVLLYERSPRAFLEWAKNDSSSANGILPSSTATNPNAALDTALAGAGVPTQGEVYQAALAAPLDPGEARAVLALGLLAKKNFSKAQDVAGRDAADIKLTELQDLCAELGVSAERLEKLEFKEVYPGYFTVVDPSLSEELHAAGARYLYSTADNPERVHQMLTGGQKSSLTRFQEGLLIQGKSSSRDFETGGASSVFSRLVTDSVLAKVKRGESGTETTFYDWSGSRPYKLILNRKLLDRTDWYGFNGDNFGRTTDLKAENHGVALVKTINASFSRSNELCFPVGNDPSYVDYVACATEDQKKQLITFLEGKGITAWNGKPLADFIIVPGTKLMDHPDDVTLASSVRDAIVLNGLKDAITAATPAVDAAIAAKVDEGAPAVARALAEAQVKAAGRTNLESHLGSSARTAATGAVTSGGALLEALDVEGTKAKVADVATEAAKTRARAGLEDLSTYSTYSLDSATRAAAEAKAQAVAEETAKAVLDKLISEHPGPADSSADAKTAVRDALEAALRPAIRSRMAELTHADGAEAARAKAEAMVVESGPSNVRSAAQTAAREATGDAAVAATSPEALAALLQAAEQAARAKLEELALPALKDRGPGWLRSAVRAEVEAKATAMALEVAGPTAVSAVTAAGQAKVEELAKAAQEAFAAKNPAKVTPELEAALPAAIQAVVAELAQSAAERLAKAAGSTLGAKHTEAALTAVIEELGPGVAAEAIASLASAAARAAAEAPIRTAAQATADGVYQDAIKVVAEEVKVAVAAQLAQASLDRVGQALGDRMATWAVNYKLSAAVDAIMAKVPPAAPPPS